MTLLEEYLCLLQEDDINNLDETKRTSRSVITRKAKINRAIGSLSTGMAKKKNDPLFKMMKKHKELYKKYKAQLIRKYRGRVVSRARR